MSEGKVVKAQPVYRRQHTDSEAIRLLGKFCYHFPQYTFAQARKLPKKTVRILIEAQQRVEAERMLQLLNIITAPHTKRGMGVKKIASHYERMIDA